jgi:lactoylglutathione lyase
VKDPDGYTFALIQRSIIHDPFIQISLRVGDLERDIKFYEKVTIQDILRRSIISMSLQWFMFDAEMH